MNYKSKRTNRVRKKQRVKPIRFAQTPPIDFKNYVVFSKFGGSFASFGEEHCPEENGVIATISPQAYASDEYTPDKEVLSAVFPQTPLTNLEDLHDSGSFSCIEDSYEERTSGKRIDDEAFDSLDNEEFDSLLIKIPSWLEED